MQVANSIEQVKLGGKDVWSGAQLETRTDWIAYYEPAELAELDQFVLAADRRYESYLQIAPQDIQLPLLAKKFAALRDNLEHGYGFQLVRGLPTDSYTDKQNQILFWALSHLVGTPEGQDRIGSRMHSVRDKGKDLKTDNSARGYETNSELTFHNDGGDAFMLLCLKTAVSGGVSRLVSVGHIYNRVLETAPHLLETLQQDFYFDAREQHPQGLKVQVVPIFNFYAGKLSALYKRSYILSGQRFPESEVPRLSEHQLEALALVEQITQEPQTRLEFQMQVGDIQIGNNYSILHSRTAYVDHDKLEDKRHNLRTWLTLPNGRPLPAAFANTREFSQSYASRSHG